MPDRRYSEQEIAEIFKQAARAQESSQRQFGHRQGLTLSDLQDIGRESGITPEFIARAAASVERVKLSPAPTRFLGVQISAARGADLPASFSDTDWDQLVSDLRRTFHAKGKVSTDGALREWRNGNLHAVVEPTKSGYRLHLATLKGNARGGIGMSVTFSVIGALMLMISMLAAPGSDVPNLVTSLIMTTVGLGTLLYNAYDLPRWARTREQQMDDVINRVLERSEPIPVMESLAPMSARVDIDLDDAVDAAPVTSKAGRRDRA